MNVKNLRWLGVLSIVPLLGVVYVGISKGNPAPSTTTPSPSSSIAAANASAHAPGAISLPAGAVERAGVRMAAVETASAIDEIVLPGEAVLLPDGEAEAGALVSGRISAVLATEGDRVHRGQVLAWVDSADAARAAADVLRAAARTTSARRKLDRQLQLEKDGATSPNAVDEARAEASTALADLAAARTVLSNLGGVEPGDAPSEGRAVSARVAVRAPSDGVVVQRVAVLGAPVSPDRSLFKIASMERLVVEAKVPETWLSAVRPGATATLHSRSEHANETPCESAAIGSVEVVDPVSRTVISRLRPSAPCAWLRPGRFVDVRLRVMPTASERSALPTIPREAMSDIRGTPVVFIADSPTGPFRVRAVRPGAPLGGRIQIESGLSPGELLVINGTVLLKGELLRAELEGD